MEKKEAIIDFDNAISINPNYKLAYDYRAVIKFQLGQDEEALKDQEKASELSNH